MKNHTIFSLSTCLMALVLLSGIASAATITLENGAVAGPGESTTVRLVLDEAPDGLAGFFVNITVDPNVARITSVAYPSWAVLKSTNGLYGGNEVELKAIDGKKEIQAGAKNIELATITLQGVNPGSTSLHLHNEVVDSDTKGHIPRVLVDGGLTVGTSQAAVNQLTATMTPPAVISNPENSVPDGVSPVDPGVTPKVTYVASGTFIPVIGVLLGILIICWGGRLRRE
jgi:hypothetical protein